MRQDARIVVEQTVGIADAGADVAVIVEHGEGIVMLQRTARPGWRVYRRDVERCFPDPRVMPMNEPLDIQAPRTPDRTYVGARLAPTSRPAGRPGGVGRAPSATIATAARRPRRSTCSRAAQRPQAAPSRPHLPRLPRSVYWHA